MWTLVHVSAAVGLLIRLKVKSQVVVFLCMMISAVVSCLTAFYNKMVCKDKLKLLFILYKYGMNLGKVLVSYSPNGLLLLSPLSTGHRGTGHRSKYDREVCHRYCLWSHLPVHLWALPNHHQVRTTRIYQGVKQTSNKETSIFFLSQS